jgi:predicted nucleotidyltransferase/DNA-binding XRE family transcriptional regulator
MDILSEPRESTKIRPYISELLSKERIKLGLTQIDFARKIGVGVKTIRKIEQGDLSLNFQKIKYIFNAVGLDLVPSELVTSPIDKGRIFDRDEILSLLSNILSVFKIKYGVRELSLFGSYAKDMAEIDSDIDVLIDTEKRVGLEAEGEMKLILETLFDGKSIDLTFRKNLRDEFKNEIMESKIDVQEKL